MKFKYLSSDAGADDFYLDAIQSKIGIPLPNEYLNFLKKFNGVRPFPPVEIELPHGGTDLQLFYGVGPGLNDVEKLHYWIDPIARPEGIAIANDSGANVFWIYLAKGDYGSVHFEHRDWKPNCCKLAENWGDFLGLFYELL